MKKLESKRLAIWSVTAIATLSLSVGLGRAANAQLPGSKVASRVLVQFRANVSEDAAQHIIAATGAKQIDKLSGIRVRILNLPTGADEEAMVRAFAKRPDVEFAETDTVLRPANTPNDPQFTSQWHLNKISAPTAWDSTTGSNAITIAVIDTGVDSTHPDLSSRIVPGWNLFNNSADTSDVYNHGTAVAGTIAAATNNAAGVAGVTWNCKIMPLRVDDGTGYAYFSTVANALTYGADHGARVANVNYEVTNSAAVRSAADYFLSKGGVVVAPAGNSAVFDASADNPSILTVGATTNGDTLATWSNTGNTIDLVAPGSGIYTTTKGGGYQSWSGTCFSSAIVSGVAGLVLSTNPNLTPGEVQTILKQSADDFGASGWDTAYGWGRVNAARAVSQARGGSTDSIAPSIRITNPTDGSTVSGTVSVQTTASDNVGVTLVDFYVDGVLKASDTTAPYSFAWNTTGVSNGSHLLRAMAKDAVGNASGSDVTVTVSNTSTVVDGTPPSVTITSPQSGAKVNGNISVTVVATDNIGVTKVELYVDGAIVSTSTIAPFTNTWNARQATAGTHTLQCKAYDAAGNGAVSPVVTVSR